MVKRRTNLLRESHLATQLRSSTSGPYQGLGRPGAKFGGCPLTKSKIQKFFLSRRRGATGTKTIFHTKLFLRRRVDAQK